MIAMTQEEKAKAYDEAYKVAESIHRFSSNPAEIKRMEEIFPQLRESKDERIRKGLVAHLKDLREWEVGKFVPIKTSGHYDAWLAWLEKQGEQKPAFEMKTPEESLGIDSDTYNKIVDECIYGEQKPADNAEPKFHKGEWVVNNTTFNSCHVLKVEHGQYVCDDCSFSITKENEYHLWTIQDAKPGDVLADGNLPFIFKKIDTNKYSYAYCGISVDYGFRIESEGESGEWTWMQDIKPATKEQRDTLMKAMTDAGWEFDFEKKELNRIEQMPVWSEEDERLCQCLIEDQEEALDNINNDKYGHSEIISDLKEMYNERISWLKSLRGRVQPKQKWSEEDENHVKSILSTIECCKAQFPNAQAVVEAYNADIEWLNSIRPQNRWKPSDAQMASITCAVRKMKESACYDSELVSLLSDLKKLRKE